MLRLKWVGGATKSSFCSRFLPHLRVKCWRRLWSFHLFSVKLKELPDLIISVIIRGHLLVFLFLSRHIVINSVSLIPLFSPFWSCLYDQLTNWERLFKHFIQTPERSHEGLWVIALLSSSDFPKKQVRPILKQKKTIWGCSQPWLEHSSCWMRSSVSSYSVWPPADWQSDAAKSENGLNCSQNTYTGLDPEKDHRF